MPADEIIVEYTDFDIAHLTMIENKYILYKQRNLILNTGIFSCMDKDFIEIQPIIPILAEISKIIRSKVYDFDDDILIGKRKFMFRNRPSIIKDRYYCKLQYKFMSISKCCSELNCDLMVIPDSIRSWMNIRELSLS